MTILPIHSTRKLHVESLESKDLLTAVGFEEHTVISTVEQGTVGLVSFSPADIDGDGDVDIVTSSAGDSKIAWLENLDGEGEFSLPRPIDLQAISANDILTADFDGDGDIDILSLANGDFITRLGRQIGWYENLDGKGRFGAVQSITSDLHYASSIHIHDVDQDGALDVITSREDRRTVWFRNEGSESLFGEQLLLFDELETESLSRLGDIDGDGDLDYVLFNSGFNQISWYNDLNEARDFESRKTVSLGDGDGFPIRLADIDGDNDDDLVLATLGASSHIRWRENIAEGQAFGEEQTIDSTFVYASSFHTADLDGDGDNDLIVSSSHGIESDGLFWYENRDGKGTFGEPNEISKEAIRVSTITTADFDGDGDLDALSGSVNDGKVSWYENQNGRGQFSERRTLTQDAGRVESLVAADLDGDGDSDLVAASRSNGRIAWYQNLDGKGNFSAQRTLTLDARSTSSVTVSDIDSDGDLDILYSRRPIPSRGVPAVYWHENRNGKGDFGPAQPIETQNTRDSTVLSADIDGDGHNDLVLTSLQDDSVSWYQNLGYGTSWGTEQYIVRDSEINSEYTAAAADIDGDGDVDLVSSSSLGDTIAWYENIDGRGTFFPNGVRNRFGDETRAISIADLDNDGDLDVLGSWVPFIGGDPTIIWYENLDGHGFFSNAKYITSDALGTRSLAVADMDGDGDLDVLSASTFDGDKMAWYENLDGKGAFGPQIIITDQILGARAILAVDIDGDGDNDVVTGSADDGKILWFENRKVGDSNNDGLFNSSDLVAIFQAGEYEDDIPMNSKFSEGDWNGDGDFTTADLVLAFQAGTYESPGQQAVESVFAEREWYSELSMSKAKEELRELAGKIEEGFTLLP